MKTLLIICILLLHCTGPTGPSGPQGETGEQGQTGIQGESGLGTILTYTGTIQQGMWDYVDGYWEIPITYSMETASLVDCKIGYHPVYGNITGFYMYTPYMLYIDDSTRVWNGFDYIITVIYDK